MSPNPTLEYTMMAEALLCVSVVAVAFRTGLVRKFGFVAGLAAVWGMEISISVATLFFRRKIGLSLPSAYSLYFYTFWICSVIGYILTLALIYQVFHQSMTPFRGLQRLGTMVFRWVCGVCVLFSLGIAIVPAHGYFGYLTAALQIQQGLSILMICLLLFVCFSAHYLGMTYRTRLFGVSLGLGVQGVTNLLLIAWTSKHGEQSLYSSVYLLPAIGAIVTMSIWGTYFLLPEPAQQMVLLPTTSPYFHWNQVSEALGDHPGMVAVAGFTPDMLSAAERKMLGASVSKRRSPAGSRELVNRVVASVDVPAQEHAVAMPR